MLGEPDRGRNLDSSRQVLNQYLDRWFEVCTEPRPHAKSLQDYEGLHADTSGPAWVQDIGDGVLRSIFRCCTANCFDEGLSARSIRLHSGSLATLKQAVRWNLILANRRILWTCPERATGGLEHCLLNKRERSLKQSQVPTDLLRYLCTFCSPLVSHSAFYPAHTTNRGLPSIIVTNAVATL
jgi:hypothetical protein